MEKKIIFIIILFIVCIRVSLAQVTVSGTVKDESNLPMVGVSIVEKGTFKGNITDQDGKYKIQLKDQNSTIQFSMIGYVKQEVMIGDRKVINVIMVEKYEQLEEVVVVAFGSQKKISITGAISNISSETLKMAPVSNITNALFGRIPGLVVKESSGKPGSDAATVLIRGQATFNSISPLCLVDGVERSFGTIDANEIETVSVLKDASATAVYGVRGANGVILITTKRGLTGKPTITATSSAGMMVATQLPQYVNSYDYARMYNEACINDNLPLKYSAADLQHYLSGDDPYGHPNTNWKDLLFEPGYKTQHNLNVRGGNDILKYFASASYLYQGDIFDYRKNPLYDASINYKRLNLRSNVDVNVSKTTVLGIDLGIRQEITNQPYAKGLSVEDAVVFASLRCPSNAFNPRNPNGSYGGTADYMDQNALRWLESSGFKRNFINTIEGTGRVSQKLDFITTGLAFRSMYSFNSYYSNTRSMWGREKAIYQYSKDQNGVETYTQLEAAQSLRVEVTANGPMNTRTQTESALTYNKSLGKHDVSGLAVFSMNKYTGGSTYSLGYKGLAGRATYSYDRRYLCELNLGYNGSSKFDLKYRYDLFPAMSVGWIASNEPFMKKLKDNHILDYMKWRFSYGEVGNDKTGSYSTYYAENYPAGGSVSFGENITSFSGRKEGSLPNSEIYWERSSKFNAGLDLKLAKERLSINADVFFERRTDILSTRKGTPWTAGLGGGSVATLLPPQNFGIVENKGYEIELNWNDQIGKDFSYSIGGNYSFARNKIIEEDEEKRLYDYQYETGGSIGRQWAYTATGIFQSLEEINSSPAQPGVIAPGDVKLLDKNKDGIVNSFDASYLGYPIYPEINYGIYGGLSYKGFDLNILFQGVANTTIILQSEAAWAFNNKGSILQSNVGNRWAYYTDPITGDVVDTRATATMPKLTTTPTGNNSYGWLSTWIRDGSYIRLKNIEIGYTLPKSITRKWTMEKVRISLSGNNLHTWSAMKDFDPEVAAQNGEFYPLQKIYNVNVSITF